MMDDLKFKNQKDSDRFWSRVDKGGDGGCWLWTGSKFKSGYGQIGPRRKDRLAHRVSFANERGAIPGGMSVLHKCDVRACVNPDHMFIGTQSDNMRDKTQKGRQLNGVDMHQTKLDDFDILFIRSWLRLGYTQESIAAAFCVTRENVHYIGARKTWKHVA